jgi:hypothetical protein
VVSGRKSKMRIKAITLNTMVILTEKPQPYCPARMPTISGDSTNPILTIVLLTHAYALSLGSNEKSSV